MTIYNKINLASEMLVEAHKRYTSACRDIDYITSILLSGAVIGIVSPLLKEQDGHTMHELLSRISNLIADPNEESFHEGMFREVYNSLKHAGNKKVTASNDLEIQTDFKREASVMLEAAKHDFREIKVFPQLRTTFSNEFILLLEATEN